MGNEGPRILHVIRFQKGPYGVFSRAEVMDPAFYQLQPRVMGFMLERPMPGEVADHPCIPAGDYDLEWMDKKQHPQHDPCYEVMNVPGRTAILLHSANWFEQLLGCLAPGLNIARLQGEYEKQQIDHLGVTSSKDALKMFLDALGRRPAKLSIREDFKA